MLAALDMTKWEGSTKWWRFYKMVEVLQMARFYNMWKGRANL